jgi:hypothetical protein
MFFTEPQRTIFYKRSLLKLLALSDIPFEFPNDCYENVVSIFVFGLYKFAIIFHAKGSSTSDVTVKMDLFTPPPYVTFFP